MKYKIENQIFIENPNYGALGDDFSFREVESIDIIINAIESVLFDKSKSESIYGNMCYRIDILQDLCSIYCYEDFLGTESTSEIYTMFKSYRNSLTKDESIGLQNKIRYLIIKSESDFATVLSEPVALIWFDVDWSGVAHYTRGRFLSFLERNEVQFPIYCIDCSQQDLTFVESWLKEHNKGPFDYLNLYFGGNGEMALIKQGVISDYLYRPNLMTDIMFEKKLGEWLNKI